MKKDELRTPEPTFLQDDELTSQFPTFVTRKPLSERYGVNPSDTLASVLARHTMGGELEPRGLGDS